MEFEKLQEIISEILNVEPSEIAIDTPLADELGADSMDMFQIAAEVEGEFGVEVPMEELEQIATIQDILDFIRNKKM